MLGVHGVSTPPRRDIRPPPPSGESTSQLQTVSNDRELHVLEPIAATSRIGVSGQWDAEANALRERLAALSPGPSSGPGGARSALRSAARSLEPRGSQSAARHRDTFRTPQTLRFKSPTTSLLSGRRRRPSSDSSSSSDDETTPASAAEPGSRTRSVSRAAEPGSRTPAPTASDIPSLLRRPVPVTAQGFDRFRASPDGPAARLESEKADALSAARAAKDEERTVAAGRLMGGLKGVAFEALQAGYLSAANPGRGLQLQRSPAPAGSGRAAPDGSDDSDDDDDDDGDIPAAAAPAQRQRGSAAAADASGSSSALGFCQADALLADSPADSQLVRRLRAALRAERRARLETQAKLDESLEEQAKVSAAACSILSAAAAKIRNKVEAVGSVPKAAHLPELERLHLLARLEAERQRGEALRVELSRLQLRGAGGAAPETPPTPPLDHRTEEISFTFGSGGGFSGSAETLAAGRARDEDLIRDIRFNGGHMTGNDTSHLSTNGALTVTHHQRRSAEVYSPAANVPLSREAGDGAVHAAGRRMPGYSEASAHPLFTAARPAGETAFSAASALPLASPPRPATKAPPAPAQYSAASAHRLSSPVRPADDPAFSAASSHPIWTPPRALLQRDAGAPGALSGSPGYSASSAHPLWMSRREPVAAPPGAHQQRDPSSPPDSPVAPAAPASPLLRGATPEQHEPLLPDALRTPPRPSPPEAFSIAAFSPLGTVLWVPSEEASRSPLAHPSEAEAAGASSPEGRGGGGGGGGSSSSHLALVAAAAAADVPSPYDSHRGYGLYRVWLDSYRTLHTDDTGRVVRPPLPSADPFKRQSAESLADLLSSLAAAEGTFGRPGPSPSSALGLAVRMAADDDGMISVHAFRNIAAASALLA